MAGITQLGRITTSERVAAQSRLKRTPHVSGPVPLKLLTRPNSAEFLGQGIGLSQRSSETNIDWLSYHIRDKAKLTASHLFVSLVYPPTVSSLT